MEFSQVRGKGNSVIYSVASKFKQAGAGAPWVVTLTLYNAWDNSFWDKHILREGDSSRETYLERKALMGGATATAELMTGAIGKGIMTGANRSTFIRLKNIDLKDMVYCLAKAMLENYLGGAWPGVGSYNAHLPIEAVFAPSNCVVSFDNVGAKTYARSIRIGGGLQGAAGQDLAFNLNHCGGSGATT